VRVRGKVVCLDLGIAEKVREKKNERISELASNAPLSSGVQSPWEAGGGS